MYVPQKKKKKIQRKGNENRVWTKNWKVKTGAPDLNIKKEIYSSKLLNLRRSKKRRPRTCFKRGSWKRAFQVGVFYIWNGDKERVREKIYVELSWLHLFPFLTQFASAPFFFFFSTARPTFHSHGSEKKTYYRPHLSGKREKLVSYPLSPARYIKK